MTAADAYDAMLAHHQVLGEELSARVSAVTAAGQPHEPAVARLFACLAGEIVPHAAAEEATIYLAAAALECLVGTVRQMTDEHKVLPEAPGRLAGTVSAADAAQIAEEIARVFAAHVAKENDVLLPALAASKNADLPALLADMQRRTTPTAPASPADGTGIPDPQETHADRSPDPGETGDPACWARLVCEECGAVISDGHGAGCSQSRACPSRASRSLTQQGIRSHMRPPCHRPTDRANGNTVRECKRGERIAIREQRRGPATVTGLTRELHDPAARTARRQPRRA